MIENAEMINGTGGKPEYVVIQAANSMALGLKPVWERDSPMTLSVGLRIRAVMHELDDSPKAAEDGKDSNVLNLNPKVGTTIAGVGGKAQSVYPNITFTKVKHNYASVFIGTVVPLSAVEGPKALWALLEEGHFFDKVTENANPMLFGEDCPELRYPKEDILAHWKETITEKYQDMCKELGVSDAEEEKEADVLEFPIPGKDNVH